MRSAATDEDIDLALSPLSPLHIKLKVEIDRDGSGSGFVEVNDIDGDDFVRGCTFKENLDAPAVAATVNLAAWMHDPRYWSLIPSMTNSNLHTGGALCKPYNRIKISAAVGSQHGALTDYHLLFDGRIRRWRHSKGGLALDCLDLITDLQVRSVKTENQYGHEDPASVTYANMEEIIQNILDDHINTVASSPRTDILANRTDGSPWQLWGPTGTTATKPFPAADQTGAGIRLEMVAKRTIWDAISQYPGGIAYRLSRRWHNGAGAFVLTLEEPDRLASTPDITIDTAAGEGGIIDATLGNEDVRNSVQIGYQVGGGRRDVYENSNAASITAYGEQWMGVDVGFSSQVDSSAEAQKMGDGILSDAKDPLIELSVATKFMWFLQLNDLVRVLPDYVSTDVTNDLALIGYESQLTNGGGGGSILRLRGKPAASILGHARKQRLYVSEARSVRRMRVGGSVHANPHFADDGRV